MAVKGWHKTVDPMCYFTGESIENGYRIVFMFFNCILFVWVYDDKSGLHRPVNNMDLYSLDQWNQMVRRSFLSFLECQEKKATFYFLRDSLLKSEKFWEVINLKDSNVSINILNLSIQDLRL